MVATLKKLAGGRKSGDYYLGKGATLDNYYTGEGEEALRFYSLQNMFAQTGDKVPSGLFRDLLEGYAPSLQCSIWIWITSKR